MDDYDPRSAKAVGARIRKLRKDACIKQIGLAKDLSVTPGQISQWETGYANELPPEYRLRQMAEVLRSRLGYLVAGETPPHEEKVDGRAVPGERARRIEEAFKDRLQVALGVALTEWKPRELSVGALAYVLNACELTLMDITALDAGTDMKAALKVLNTISRWAEQAFKEGIPVGGPLLFRSHAKAVHFKCYVGSPKWIIDITNRHFGKMSLVSSTDTELWRQQCGWQGDVLKVALAHYPGLRQQTLKLFEEAHSANRVDYHTIRSPATVAASAHMSDSEYENYISWIDDALDSGTRTAAETVHLVEAKAGADANRYRVKDNDETYKKRALAGREEAQRRAREVGGRFGEHSEFWLRVKRLNVDLWEQDIRDHVSEPGMPIEESMAAEALSLHNDAVAIGSDRIAETMLARFKKYDR